MSEQMQEQQVECRPAKHPLVRRVILAAMLFGFGIWCMIDMGNYPYKPMDQDINKFASWAFNAAVCNERPVAWVDNSA